MHTLAFQKQDIKAPVVATACQIGQAIIAAFL